VLDLIFNGRFMRRYLLIFFFILTKISATPCANQCSTKAEKEGFLSNARHCYRDCNSKCWGGIFNATLLVWQAKEDELEFAARNSTFQTQGVNLNASNVFPDFDWEPGVKIGLGLFAPCRDWDFYVNWTYYHANSKTSVSVQTSPDGFGLIPLWRHPVGTPVAQRFADAHAKWLMDFYTLDAELGYSMMISRCLDLRFHAGLKAALINQGYGVCYQNGQLINGIQVLTGEVDLKNNSRGLGPRIGLQAKWRLSKDWFIQSSGAVASILAQFNLLRNELDKALDTATSEQIITDINYSEIIWVWKPQAEAILGLGWQHCFCSYSFHADLFYEIQYFWEQNLMRRFTDELVEALNVALRGDLMLHGINIQFRFDF